MTRQRKKVNDIINFFWAATDLYGSTMYFLRASQWTFLATDLFGCCYKVWVITQGSNPQTNKRRQRNSIFIRWKLSSECRLSPYANLIQSGKGVQCCLHNNTIIKYFCQFSELDADTYVGHRRLLCRGGHWSTWSYMIVVVVAKQKWIFHGPPHTDIFVKYVFELRRTCLNYL